MLNLMGNDERKKHLDKKRVESVGERRSVDE
jgi:hypothetical protein